MNTGKTQIIAHRGGRVWAPENTMAAFSKSLELGVDGIELDIQRCATGELVVFHDEELSRTTNGVGLVADSSLEELKRLSAGAWFDKAFTAEKIPTLQEVLELVAGKCVLNIEIKNSPIGYDGIEEELLSLLENYSAIDKVIVSSFDHNCLFKLKTLAPYLNLALLLDGILLDMPAYAERLGCKYFHPCFSSCRADVVEEAHRAGLIINSWTINGRFAWRMAINMGIDGLVTDDPYGLAQALGRVPATAQEAQVLSSLA
jgi:glycerophosphoryl diester phosphodiesterase